ncbi:transporter substrate-binding domain-containing protein [Desulfatiferula olefinivorans]
MKQTFFSIAVLFVMMSVSPAYCAEPIKLASLNWEPYIGESLTSQGYVAELVSEAFKRSGFDVEITYLPWARVVKLSEDGVYDGYLPEYYSDSLNEKFLVSDPLPGGPLGLFKRKESVIPFKGLEDLKPFRIGVVRGYINTAEFDAADYLNKDEATDDLQNFKKLLKKRVDLVVSDQYVGIYTIKNHMPDALNLVEFISPPLETKDLFLCISKKASGHTLKMKVFNENYRKMKEDGTVDRILAKHGFGGK